MGGQYVPAVPAGPLPLVTSVLWGVLMKLHFGKCLMLTACWLIVHFSPPGGSSSLQRGGFLFLQPAC